MHIPYKTNWGEAGNDLYKMGSIHREKVPLIIWILDKWFEYIHEITQKFPGYHRFWEKVLPTYGDPICFAYCFPWSKFVWKHTVQEYNVEVGFDKLSQQYRDWYSKEVESK